MGDIVNLRRVRKRAAQQRRVEEAAANRLVYGQSKSERAIQKARNEKVARELDRHRLGSGEANEITGRKTVNRDRGAQDERQS
jgi:hypothetical protein